MNENIDLTKILKNCPKGTKLYSSICGEVYFKEIRNDYKYPIITTKGCSVASFTEEGFYYVDTDGECTLFPSKDNRDWSKFTAPWYKKEKFDPKTLKAFDRVLVRNKCGKWKCGLFSHFDDEESEYIWCCVGSEYIRIIPYNEETKHLVGTKDEAPDFYKYWED